jgi:hypothetical protein
MSTKTAAVIIFALFLGYAGAIIFPPSDIMKIISEIPQNNPENFSQHNDTHIKSTISNITTIKTETNTQSIFKTISNTTRSDNSITSSETIKSESELYALSLVNEDRLDWDVDAVSFGSDSSAQEHSDDLASMCVLSHWDSGGMKPYMRYSLSNGEGIVTENAAIVQYSIPTNPTPSMIRNAIADLEYNMMYNDAGSNWGHRDNIINPFHNKVSFGISIGKKCIVLVQHFEDDYIDWKEYPHLDSDKILLISGTIKYPLKSVNSIHIAFDPLPTLMSASDLEKTPHSYSLGEWIGGILYGNSYFVDIETIYATQWSVDHFSEEISFEISANLESLLNKGGNGVYTIVIVAEDDKNQSIMLTEISIFVEDL